MFGENSVPLWTAIAALSACVTIVVTCIYSTLTVKLMRDQVAPKVIVFLRTNRERATLIFIVIRNVGADTAEQVAFTASRKIPEFAFGLPKSARQPAKVMTEGPLINGIPALGPGEEREILWGQYGGLSYALEEGPLVLSFSYRQGSRKFKGNADLELASFAHTDAAEAASVVAVRHLDKIAKGVDGVAQTLRRWREAERKPREYPWNRAKRGMRPSAFARR